jgi:Dolichyl-phosphate-mannose-protein mannosyltransferase
MAHRLRPSRPIVLLAVISLLSLAARVALLGEPCQSPCRDAAAHVLIFDEVYYVNAARVIAGIHPPAGQNYARAPLGDDPNAEHPQLAKLVIAGAIELFGDGPFAWRIGSILLGSLAILGMFALARAAGAGDWPAFGAAALMAADNLLLVHGRIATLDIYVVCFMVWGAALYVRGRPGLGGAVLGLGACSKLVAPYALPALVLFELFGPDVVTGAMRRDAVTAAMRRNAVTAALRRLVAATLTGTGAFFALLAALDRIAPPWNPLTRRRVPAGPFHHLGHMISYASGETSPHGPRGIASYPWEWLVDFKPITYLNINPSQPTPQLSHIHPQTLFLGMMSPPIMLLGIPSLGLAAAAVAGRRALSARLWLSDEDEPGSQRIGRASALGLAWVVGTLLPFAALSAVWQRTSYLYYMVVVMPGIYLTVACLAVKARSHRRALELWIASVAIAVVVTYPFVPLF